MALDNTLDEILGLAGELRGPNPAAFGSIPLRVVLIAGALWVLSADQPEPVQVPQAWDGLPTNVPVHGQVT